MDQADAHLMAAAPELFAALATFVREYVQLVESGDAGFWDAEAEAKVIAARAALAKALFKAEKRDCEVNGDETRSPNASGQREGAVDWPSSGEPPPLDDAQLLQELLLTLPPIERHSIPDGQAITSGVIAAEVPHLSDQPLLTNAVCRPAAPECTPLQAQAGFPRMTSATAAARGMEAFRPRKIRKRR